MADEVQTLKLDMDIAEAQAKMQRMRDSIRQQDVELRANIAIWNSLDDAGKRTNTKLANDIAKNTGNLKQFNAEVTKTKALLMGVSGGGGLNRNQMMQQVSFGMSDFMSQFSNAGFAAGLRGAANNLEMLVMGFHPLAGLAVGATVAIAGMIPGLKEWGKANDEAKAKVDAHKKALADLGNEANKVKFGNSRADFIENRQKIIKDVIQPQRDKAVAAEKRVKDLEAAPRFRKQGGDMELSPEYVKELKEAKEAASQEKGKLDQANRDADLMRTLGEAAVDRDEILEKVKKRKAQLDSIKKQAAGSKSKTQRIERSQRKERADLEAEADAANEKFETLKEKERLRAAGVGMGQQPAKPAANDDVTIPMTQKEKDRVVQDAIKDGERLKRELDAADAAAKAFNKNQKMNDPLNGRGAAKERLKNGYPLGAGARVPKNVPFIGGDRGSNIQDALRRQAEELIARGVADGDVGDLGRPWANKQFGQMAKGIIRKKVPGVPMGQEGQMPVVVLDPETKAILDQIANNTGEMAAMGGSGVGSSGVSNHLSRNRGYGGRLPRRPYGRRTGDGRHERTSSMTRFSGGMGVGQQGAGMQGPHIGLPAVFQRRNGGI